ncbi:DUF47 family protein [Bacillota bacterium LX-D]|nr:DUF47 family protein [Bacillota bacterium LX-D]
MRHNFLENLIPPKYNFFQMLSSQARTTAWGINALFAWVKEPNNENNEKLQQLIRQANETRFAMEKQLIEAFTTPFDRQDIYFISVQMNRILEHASSTSQAITAYLVTPDENIIKMVAELTAGTAAFAEAIEMLEKDALSAQSKIIKIRQAQENINNYYRKGMAHLFGTTDAMYALKYREIYHHIKDAAMYLGMTADTFHKIVVGLA